MTPPDTKTTQARIAELAGVSRATVSRALNDNPRISADVRTRIKSLAAKLDYRPNAAARSFVTSRHNVLGMLLLGRDLEQSIYGRLVAGVETAARTVGQKFQLSVVPMAALEGRQLVPMLRDDSVDGIVVAGVAPDWLLDRFEKWRLPTVLISQNAGRAVHQVGGNPERGGQLVAKHLVGLGHRALAAAIGPRHTPIHAAYLAGFQGVCQSAGARCAVRECPNIDVIGPMRSLFAEAPETTAVFTDTQQAAFQSIQYLRAIGRHVPTDVSVAGAGASLTQSDIPPHLRPTHVDVQPDEFGRAAVDLLLQAIADPGLSPRQITIDPKLVPAQTTAPPPPQAHP